MRAVCVLAWLSLIKSLAALESCEAIGRIRLSPHNGDKFENESYRLLQVCLFGHWSYVCGDALHERDENVVQNQLGCSSETDIQNSNSSAAVPVYINRINCRGIERELLKCRHDRLTNITNCAGRVGVQDNCARDATASSCQNGELMKNENTNILYICVTNTWMVLCPRWWTPAQTTVACRQLHPHKTVIRGTMTTVARDSSDKYFSFHFYCSGEESAITDCATSGIDTMRVGCPVTDTTLAVGIRCDTQDAETPEVSYPLAWLGGGAIGVVLSAIFLSTFFVFAVILRKIFTQRKKPNQTRGAFSHELSNSTNINSISQPVPYDDCQIAPAEPRAHNYANFAVYDTVSDAIIGVVASGQVEQRNPAAAADTLEAARFSFSKGEQGTGAYSQLDRQ